MNKFLLILLLFAFFFSCTNYVPVSAILSPIGLSLSLAIFKKNTPNFLYFLLVFFLISVLSIIMYDSGALLKYDFYRYDANFVISYAPLFLIPFVSVNINIKKVLISFIYTETTLNLFAFIITFIGNHFILSAELSFGSLFIARNAAGGFLSFCITIIFLLFWESKKLKYFILLILNIFFLLSTYSRGSILGIVFCILLFLLFKKYMGKLAVVLILVCLVIEVVLVMQTFDVYKRLSVQRNGFDYVTESLEKDQDTKSSNIVIRLLYAWPSGIDEFLHSPLIGAGFGSINDRPYIFENDISLVNPNKQQSKIYNDSHAHNTYFHIAGEQGLIGIVVFFSFLITMYNFFSNNDFITNNFPFLKNVILLYILNISFMSLTEHRLTTPSNVLPFTLLVVLFFTEYNYKFNKSKLSIVE